MPFQKGELNPNYGSHQFGKDSIRFGKKQSDDAKIKIGVASSQRNTGEGNPAWRGDNVGYYSLHNYVRRRKVKPEFCEICNVGPPTHLANITLVYNRDLDNWKFMCPKCHSDYDYIPDRLSEISKSFNRDPITGRFIRRSV